MHRIRLKVVLAAIMLLASGGFAQKSSSGTPPYVPAQPSPDPVLFGEGVISTPENEAGISFTPDGTSAYFTVGTATDSFRAIVVSNFREGRWDTPEMASFSGQYKDQEPALSPDGSRLFFASSRPTGSEAKSDMDIWMVEKTASGWSEPKNLGAPVNTTENEVHPCVTRDGTLYFSAIRPGGNGRADIYRSRFDRGRYTEPENLGSGVNTAADEWMGSVSSDESLLIFSSWRGPGTNDLYLSRKSNGTWQPAVNLGPRINSRAEETSPSLSPDGRYLFFTSKRQPAVPPQAPTRRMTRADIEALYEKQRGNVENGQGNLYQVEMSTVVKVAEEAERSKGETTRLQSFRSPHPYASNKRMPEPVLFEIPNVVSVDRFWHCWHTTMTPDGKSIYFMGAAGPRLEFIMESHFLDGKWSTPEVAPFSGLYWVESPSVSPDGRRFFFDKPNAQGADLWVMNKTESGWSEPRDLGAPVNKPGAFQAGASAAANGNLYFFSNRDGRMKIYRADWQNRAYGEPQALSDAINASDASQPAIAQDESFLVFCRERGGGQGGADLYISFRQNGEWSPARCLGPEINSVGHEWRPYISPDGKYLFFTSTRGFGDAPLKKRITYSELQAHLQGPLNGRNNIYQVDIAALGVGAK